MLHLPDGRHEVGSYRSRLVKPVITIALIVLFGVGVGVFLLSNQPGAPMQGDEPPELADTPASDAPGEAIQSDDAESEAVHAARQRVADAELALQTAIAQRKTAEADIQTAEREVEELERWVAEIEARGEDPVDYADEGLEKLQPAFFAYQDAAERLELAEKMEVTATEELALAKAALSAALASSSTEK